MTPDLDALAAGGAMSEHKTALREVPVLRSYCLDPGCVYCGQLAVQGHCFDRVDPALDRLLEQIEREAEASLAFYKAQHATDPAEEYLRTLEALYVSMHCNWSLCLDELIRLRRDAMLKAREGR